jgi:predicted transcriptional regulator
MLSPIFFLSKEILSQTAKLLDKIPLLCYFLLQEVDNMRETITISIPEDLKRQLDTIISQEGTTRSAIIRESLRDYLFIRQFRSLRKRMMAKAPRAYTDQDIFDRAS